VSGRRMGVAVLCALAGLGVIATTASAAKVKNGKFESDDLHGWDKDFFGPGAWLTYEGEFEGGIKTRGPSPAEPLPAPPQGQFGAVSNQLNPSAAFLSQVVKLERGKTHKLKFKLAYVNRNFGKVMRGDFPPGFHTPRHFRFSKAASPNQQFRMDVMKPGAPIKSLKNKNVLKSVYITERGDPNRRNYRTISENLTKYAGDKVRLRFAVVVTEAPLNVGLDAIKIKSKND
jgi:hypothetical protein